MRDMPKWEENIYNDWWRFNFGQSSIIQDFEYKKERKLGEHISSILNRKNDAPLWSNEDFWKNKWPKIVDDFSNEVEKMSALFCSRFELLKLAADYVERRTIFYDI